MLILSQGSRRVTNVFGLLGSGEDAITAAIAWTMASAPTFLWEFLQRSCAFSGEIGEAQLYFQRDERSRGRTDLEIVIPGTLHVIVEAKKGWELPSLPQLELYAGRQAFVAATGMKTIITISEADRRYSSIFLPSTVQGVPVLHLSRHDVRKLLQLATTRTKKWAEKRQMAELAQYLDNTMNRTNLESNAVYVVSLSRKQFTSHWPCTTFLDIYTRHSSYFHPIGGKGGWPVTPPNYLGVRYDGRLQAIHHITSATVIKDLADVASGSYASLPCDSHFLYRLGPAIRPATPVVNGSRVTQSTRVWAALDLLLTAPSITEAMEGTKARLPT